MVAGQRARVAARGVECNFSEIISHSDSDRWAHLGKFDVTFLIQSQIAMVSAGQVAIVVS